jgi:hypothetical protein
MRDKPKTTTPAAKTQEPTSDAMVFDGWVQLWDQAMNMDLAMSRGLISQGALSKIGGGDVMRFLPPEIHIEMTGTLKKPEYDLGKSLSKSMASGLTQPNGDAAGALIDILTGSKKDQRPAPAKPKK